MFAGALEATPQYGKYLRQDAIRPASSILNLSPDLSHKLAWEPPLTAKETELIGVALFLFFQVFVMALNGNPLFPRASVF
jgi:hypothetical protein